MDRFKHPLHVVALVALVVLLFGAMSATALAAGRGEPLRLGVTNTISLLTTLSGNVSSAMLQVVNSNSGASAAAIRASNSGGGPALDLRVDPGKAPFKVNSAAKVRNLNADLLDGLDSTALQRRLTAGCEAGSSISAVAADGSVTCEADDDTTYTAGAGLALSGTTFRAQGSPYANTIVVATSGGDFTSVQAALDSITATADKPYVVYVAAGVYEEQVTLEPYVTLEGAGEGATILRWTGGSQDPASGSGSATLIGANNAEVRLLTVESAGTGETFAVAVYNNRASPRLHQVTATASGSVVNFSVVNSASSPAMRQVTATASGGTTNYTVYNISSSPAMRQVTATASGGITTNIGVYNNSSSSPTMQQVTVTASGGTSSYGVFNGNSSPTIRDSTITGTTNSIYRNGGTVKVANSQLSGPLSSGVVCFNNYDANMDLITCPAP